MSPHRRVTGYPHDSWNLRVHQNIKQHTCFADYQTNPQYGSVFQIAQNHRTSTLKFLYFIKIMVNWGLTVKIMLESFRIYDSHIWGWGFQQFLFTMVPVSLCPSLPLAREHHGPPLWSLCPSSVRAAVLWLRRSIFGGTFNGQNG